MDEATLSRYADAIVRDAVRIGPGDVLAVAGEPASRTFAVALAEAGYRAGARYVDVLLPDPRVKRLRALLADEDTLAEQPAWHDARMRALLKAGAGLVSISGPEEPDLLADVPAARAARERGGKLPGRQVYLRGVARGTARFCVVCWPTPAWATSVFPELPADDAVATLERDLLTFARIGPDDPADGWARHVERLEGLAARLTERGLRRLHVRGPGTDLRLGLPEGALWCGGTLRGPKGRFSPNVPTEEVFTSPTPSATEGTFACTRPLQIEGRTIEGIRGEFRRGRLVRVEADRADDGAFLAAYFERDRGAGRLGEIALVDDRSRVGSTGRTYRTTLLDENAASHLALGQGFRFARAPAAQGVNRSSVHVDVMIGSPELEVHGADASGAEVPVLVGGSFGALA